MIMSSILVCMSCQRVGHGSLSILMASGWQIVETSEEIIGPRYLCSICSALSQIKTMSDVSKSIVSIYLGNVPYGALEDRLKDHLSFLGLDVVDVRIVRDRETGRCRGFAFADVRGSLDRIVSVVDGTVFDGRQLKSYPAHPRSRPEDS